MASTSSIPTTTNDVPAEEERVYETWMTLQREELKELGEAAAQAKNGLKNEHQLTQLIEKTVQNFQDYANNRSCLAHIYVSPFFAPKSCTSLENSVKWIAGCRPASFVRFVYALCGMDVESNLTDFLQGKKIGELGELTSKQIKLIDELQAKTIKEETQLSSKLANLQEDIVDQPIARKAEKKQLDDSNDNDDDDELSWQDADDALDEHGEQMAGIMEEADELRMKTLKEIVFNILKPLQAVEYLAAAKWMRLCFRKWGEKRDQRHTYQRTTLP